MSSRDDPEARIRELERPLIDQSSELTHSASETGSGQHGIGYVNAPVPAASPYGVSQATYAVPPSPYGVSYPPAPATSSGGASRTWLVFAATGAVVVAIIACVVIVISNMFSSVTGIVDTFGGSPTASGGGGSFGAPPSGGNPAPAPTVATTVPIVPPGGDISVSGVGNDKTIACNDGVVDISGVGNTVVLTGQCRSLRVSGVKNVVTVDAAAIINASGFDNRITYRSGAPEIQNAGDANVVERG